MTICACAYTSLFAQMQAGAHEEKQMQGGAHFFCLSAYAKVTHFVIAN